jgi:hypothetical protein
MIEMLTPKTPNMKTTKKVKIKFLNQEFLLPSDVLRKDDWYGKENGGKYIYLNAKHTATVIRQFIKKNYPQVKAWVTSDVYSGGSSVRVQMCRTNGQLVPYEWEKEINSFTNSLKAGRFDGMYDIYEYNDEKLYTDNGTRIAGLPSYIFVENRPAWGTLEYWLREWKDFDVERYDEKIKTKYGVTDNLFETFLNFNRSFFDKGIETKLVSYMNNLHQELTKMGYTQEELAA